MDTAIVFILIALGAAIDIATQSHGSLFIILGPALPGLYMALMSLALIALQSRASHLHQAGATSALSARSPYDDAFGALEGLPDGEVIR